MRLGELLAQYMVDNGIEEVSGFRVIINDGETLEIKNDRHPALEREIGDGSGITVNPIQSATAGLSGSLAERLLSNPIPHDPQTALKRITLNPEVCFGKPTIRNMRYPVEMILDLLGAGMTFEEVLADYPDLEKEDLQACLLFASKLVKVNAIHKALAA